MDPAVYSLKRPFNANDPAKNKDKYLKQVCTFNLSKNFLVSQMVISEFKNQALIGLSIFTEA